ncbi:MAG: hypothetical protein HY538_00355 [Deltaproteobacteria bacterium]|nr:hypothetical protein [Deltaproteobacteria bacterium]
MRNIAKEIKIFEEKARFLRARVVRNWFCALLESILEKTEMEQARRTKARV